jgi:hypothetical protein
MPAPLKEITDEVNLHEKVTQGATAGYLVEFAEREIIGPHESRIRNAMFAMIDSDDPLDPMKAAQAWIELRAVYKLVKDLKRRQSEGVAAHKKLSEGTGED